MAGMSDKPEEIVLKCRQVEVLQRQGMTISKAVRQIGVTQQTYSRWHKPRAKSAIGPRIIVERDLIPANWTV